MTITEALEKNGKAKRPGCCFIYGFDGDNDRARLACWHLDGNGSLYRAGGEAIKIHLLATDWLPYEPERCEACSRLEAFIARNGEGPAMNDVAFLLQQACQCKKEAPRHGPKSHG